MRYCLDGYATAMPIVSGQSWSRGLDSKDCFKRPCEWHKQTRYRIGYVRIRCDTVAPVSVLAIFLHDLVRPGEENRRTDERQVNQNLPLDMFGVFIRDVDERF